MKRDYFIYAFIFSFQKSNSIHYIIFIWSTFMSNSTDDFTIILINNISLQVNRYMILFVFLFGTIGNLLNVIVLSQSIFRSNSCALYFLGSSASGLVIILIGLSTRIIGGWISTDPTSTNSSLCKLRIFFFIHVEQYMLGYLYLLQ